MNQAVRPTRTQRSVEAAALRVSHGGADDAPALGQGHGLLGRAERLAGSRAHFYEHHGLSVLNHQVDLSEAGAEVAREQAHALLEQELFGLPLGSRARFAAHARLACGN